MARLTVELPEGLGREGEDVARTDSGTDLRIDRRRDGGRDLPVIVRWFETWATGEVRRY